MIDGERGHGCGALVIGCGSELRRDDAAGRRVAETVGERGLSGVEVRSVTQLVPELAAEMVGRDVVVIVDARPDDGRGVRVDRLRGAPRAGGPTTHHADPRGLLVMAGVLGEAPAEMVVVTVPAADLGLGTGLSETASRAVEEAVAAVLVHCDGGARSPTMCAD